MSDQPGAGDPAGHPLIPVDGLKATREALCAAQCALWLAYRSCPPRFDERSVLRVPYWVDRIQTLIDGIDAHRPLGPDGKHGDLHTPTCECEDR